MKIRAALMRAVMLTVAVFMATDAFAQVRGKITDEWDNGLVGVEIVIELAAGGRGQMEMTDENGEFFLPNFPAGEYTFTFILEGYQAVQIPATISQLRRNQAIELELEYLGSAGGRLRGEQEFEADGGSSKITFKQDGTFEFEDTEGEDGEGHYGIVELSAVMIVRDYDGDDDKYSILDPLVATFSNDQFTSRTWDGSTLNKK